MHLKDNKVVRYCMTVVSHLILNEMLKLKGEIVDICMLLESDDQRLKDLVNLFFYELNQKGANYIYNIIPKALSKLSNELKHIEYHRFQNIVKTLLKYVEKDKHTEGLIEKLFAKLKNSVDIYEWRNTTYCLSLLSYTEKNILKLAEYYGNLKDKLDDDIVKENFQSIFNKLKKNASANKDVIEDLENKFFTGEKIVSLATLNKQNKNKDKDNNIQNTNNKKKRIGTKRNYSKMKEQDEDALSELSENEKIENTQNSQNNNIAQGRSNLRNRGALKKNKILSDNESDFNDDSDY